MFEVSWFVHLCLDSVPLGFFYLPRGIEINRYILMMVLCLGLGEFLEVVLPGEQKEKLRGGFAWGELGVGGKEN